MEEILIKKIREFFLKESGSIAAFHSPEYRALKLDRSNYHEIRPNTASKNKIAFVDGGSCILINSPDFVLSLIRVCCIIFRSNKRISVKRKECYVTINAASKNEGIFYQAEVFQFNEDLLERDVYEFNSLDPNLMTGNHRADIAGVIDIIRRLAELQMAKEALDSLGKDDIIVLDGLLECDLKEEIENMQELCRQAAGKGIIISALSKTNTIFSDNGSSLSSMLAKNAPFGQWYYYPIAEVSASNHQAEIFFARLHRNSSHVFRFEIYKDQCPDLDAFFGLMAANAKDPVFLGYPYGMLEADRLARVGNQESDMLRNALIARLGATDLSPFTSSRNAHEILDRVNY